MERMIVNGFFALSILSIFFLDTVLPLTPPQFFNASNFFLSSTALINDIDPPPNTSHLLKDVVKAISARLNWSLDDIGASNVGVRNASVGNSQRYEFRMRMGKVDLVFKFSEEVGSWRKLRKSREKLATLFSEVSSNSVLKAFELDGPFELRVDGNDDLSLVLPLNTTHAGLKRVLVGEGITVKVEGAREVSLFHASDFGLLVNRSTGVIEERSQFWPLKHSLCMPLPPIHIVGSASLVAYRTRNPSAHIETALPSQDMIELLPEKCYHGRRNRRWACPIDSLTPRLALLEKLMRTFTGDRALQNGSSGFLKAKITASTLVRFHLELERRVRNNGTQWSTMAEWRTKPKSEWAQFEVVARVEGERLKPLVVKRVRPFILADSTSWSALMSNISFTKFPSLLVPPEALTLDVKW